MAEQGQLPGVGYIINKLGVDRDGEVVVLERPGVDDVGAEPVPALREGPADAKLGHAEGGEGRARSKPEALAGGHEPAEDLGVDRLGAVEQHLER